MLRSYDRKHAQIVKGDIMKKVKRVFCVFIISMLIFLNVNICFASETTTPSWLQPILRLVELGQTPAEITSEMLKDSMLNGLRGVGFIATETSSVISDLISFLRGYNNGQFGGQNETDEQIIQNASTYFINNINTTDNSISYNNNSATLLKSYADDIVSRSGYKYVYSYRLIDHVTEFNDGTYYNALRQFIVNNSDKNVYIRGEGYGGSIYVGSKSDVFVNDGAFPSLNAYLVNSFNITSYQQTSFEYYTYSDGAFIRDSTGDGAVRFSVPYDRSNNNWYMADYGWFSVGGYNVNKMYMTFQDMQLDSQGVSPYYVSSNWQNFGVNGNYSYDSSNSNNVTYGDVINYITEYQESNNDYPSPTTINVYIDNNNPSGGGNSGGSGGGNGGGSGIGDVLGTLGSLIGSLISGIGQFLIGIFQGLVNAINSLLSLIGDAIGGIVESIPSAFNDFMTAILGWLPPEWTAIISASLLIMVIVGIIKLIRG